MLASLLAPPKPRLRLETYVVKKRDRIDCAFNGAPCRCGDTVLRHVSSNGTVRHFRAARYAEAFHIDNPGVLQ
jgi:hypothetical protein